MTRLFTAVAALLAAISMATGCAQRSTQAQQIRTISVDTSADGWETVAKSARIKKTIHLSDSLLLGNISKLLCYNGNIYLLDKSSKSILCYNGKGELQFRICTVGRGPGEYTGISNFYLSGRKNRLYIIAPEKKLLEYSASTGELLSSRPIDAKTIMFTDANLIVLVPGPVGKGHRKEMALRCGHHNYWEINIFDKNIIDKIKKIIMPLNYNFDLDE